MTTSKKQRVVFLFYHGFSHIIAILNLARILERANYEVYFAGAEFFHRYISRHGFKFKPLKSVPFGLGFETWIRTVENGKYVYLSALRDRITDRLYKEREVDLYWMLEELQPSFVFIDSRQTTDFIVLHRHLKDRKIKVAITNAMLPATTGPCRPPLNSEVFPDDPDAVKKAIDAMRWHQLKTLWKKRFFHGGYDDVTLINRRLKKNQIPAYYVSKDPSLLNFAVNNIDEFIIAPREFDFPNSIVEPRYHFIGFMTNEIDNAESPNDFNSAWPGILQVRQTQNFKIIFCSFGTIQPKDTGPVLSFLRRLMQVSTRRQYILIIAARGLQASVGTSADSDNVHIFNSVPQLQVLKHADVFITHGGLNSIREAVHTEVPMLLYPVHPEYDPIGNAARIAYHQLGLRGKATTDSEAEIDKKIKELLSNPLYKSNIRALKQRDSQYTAENFIQKINSMRTL
jgi:zeaxanthin glucosyltransferase